MASKQPCRHHWREVFLTLFAILWMTGCSPPGFGITPPKNQAVFFTATPAAATESSPPTVTARPTDTPVPELAPAATAPTATTKADPPSVFLVVFDGAPAEEVDALMQAGELPNFAQVAEEGLRAESAISIDPSITAPALNSLATGLFPAHTGIVSNAQHNPVDSFYWYRSGYEEPLSQAEPVWVSAAKAGLTTAALFYVGGTTIQPLQMADYTIGYGEREAYSKQEKIRLRPLENTWGGDAPQSFSPPLEGEFLIPRVAWVYLYALDSLDDGQENYDRLLLNTSRELQPEALELNVEEWRPVILAARPLTGADFLLQAMTNEGGIAQVTLFYSAVYHNLAAPQSLLEALDQRFGPFPPPPDAYALQHNWITEENFIQMIERSAQWSAQVSAWVYTTYQPDLLYTYLDAFDAAGHQFFLRLPEQPGYTPEKVAAYQDYYRHSAQAADRALGVMRQALDGSRTTLMVASDHGMAPAHTDVYINTILERAGLLKLDSKDYVVIKRSQAIAFSSGSSAHIYINLQGRDSEGIVRPEDYKALQTQIITLLTSQNDPVTGEPVFERVLANDELAELGLNHPLSGDVFVQARCGYTLDDWRGNNLVFQPAYTLGSHGCSSQNPEMHAIFLASGPRIKAGQIIAPVKIIDCAPTIAALLGFALPGKTDGQPMPALILP